MPRKCRKLRQALAHDANPPHPAPQIGLPPKDNPPPSVLPAKEEPDGAVLRQEEEVPGEASVLPGGPRVVW